MEEQLSQYIELMSESVRRGFADYERNRDPKCLDRLIFHVSRLLHCLLMIPSYPLDSLTSLAQSLAILNTIQESSQGTEVFTQRIAVSISGRRGRPSYEISEEQLVHLLHIGFTCTKIAHLLGVSVRTVRYRMHEFGLSVRDLYTCINDAELDGIVREIKQEYPSCGYRMMLGYLKARGIRVTQLRVKESLNRVDPVGVLLRRSQAVQRRTYNVLSPLALWHIDGNHKLIRYFYIYSLV